MVLVQRPGKDGDSENENEKDKDKDKYKDKDRDKDRDKDTHRRCGFGATAGGGWRHTGRAASWVSSSCYVESSCES